MATRRTEPAVPDLQPATVAILLNGWSAAPPEPGPFVGFAGGFLDLYDPDDAGFVRLWREHEPYLRAMARRWGWQPEWGPDGRQFYAEWLAAGGQESDVDAA